MNINTLLNTLDNIGSVGYILSTEEAIVLHNSLLILQNENHFRNIFYWGRIFGTSKDYYIAYGYVKDVLLGQIYYYSTNCHDWGLLPPPTESSLILSDLCTTRFLGDPSLIIDVLVEKYDTKIFGNETTTQKLKEDERLSATIQRINQEARIVPRGGLYKRPDSVVVENLSFEGLSELEARELTSYLHFRVPRNKWNTNLLTRKDYNYALDFLDTVDIDVPKGSWCIQTYGGNQVIVKSLYWPGMVFYHYLNTSFYGCVYIGFGKKIIDVPFSLPHIEA